MGMTPKALDAAYATMMHERSMREALAARGYIRALHEGKASDGRPLVSASWASAKELPATEAKPDAAWLIKPNLKPAEAYADYRTVDHPSLRAWRWAGKDATGKPIFVQGDLLVHPEVYRSVKNNLGRSAIQTFEVNIGGKTLRPGAAILRTGSEIKHVILSFSGFHQTTLGVHGAEHRTMPANMPEIDLADPVQSKLIDHGLMVAHFHASEAFGEGVASGGIVMKTPVIGPAYQAYAQYLFGDYMPRIKMAMAKHALERNQQRYGKTLSESQIFSLTADQANAAFGGVNYRALGRNKTFQDVLRLLLMAPDFLEARARFTGQALKPYGREQSTALMLGAAALYTAARVLNYMLDDKPHWDKPFAVVHNGKDYELRTIQGDVANLIKDPIQFLKSRFSPVASFALGALSKTNWRGEKTTFPQQVKEAVKSNVPIPVQAWTRPGTDSVAEKVVDTVFKLVGINMRHDIAGTRSPALNLAKELVGKRMPAPSPEGRSDEEVQASESGRKLREALREKPADAVKLFAQAIRDKVIRPDQRSAMWKASKQTDLQNTIEHISAGEAMQVWELANDEEKAKIQPLIYRKLGTSKTASMEQKRQWAAKLRAFKASPSP
jgi:hypothetical protein